MPMQRTHTLQATLVAVIWGLNFVAIDYGLDAFPPLLFAALRFTLVAVPAVFLVPRPQVPARIIVGVGMLVCVGQFGFLFTAMHMGMPAGLSSIVLQCQAMFTVLFAMAYLGERPARGRLVALGIAAAGLAVIAVGRGHSAGAGSFLLLLAAGASWGLGNVVTRKAGSQAGFGLVVWSGLVAPLPLFALSLGFEGWAADRDAITGMGLSGVLALGYIVVVSTFVGYGLWNNLLGRFPASSVAPYSLLVPVVGIAAAAVVLGERPTGWDWGGGALVMAGIAGVSGLLGARPDRVRRKRAATADPSVRPGYADGRDPGRVPGAPAPSTAPSSTTAATAAPTTATATAPPTTASSSPPATTATTA
ncbi:EamA family transporter [Streptodolium elevatio]|uniref:EamA family transporter n=1 Tax=Streptodolium elevatio TaxID=3157996 RepID=A0ABV3DNT3_9ACTN